MRRFFTKKILKIFIGYSLIFSVIIFFVHGNNDFIGSILFGFSLGIILLILHFLFLEQKKDSSK